MQAKMEEPSTASAAPSNGRGPLFLSPPAIDDETMSCSPNFLPDTDDSLDLERARLQLEEERRSLRSKIINIRNSRADVRREIDAVTQQSLAVLNYQNKAEERRLEALARYRSATSGRATAESQLAILRKLDATSDCFHIWHRGPFGTINGLRLGTDIDPSSLATAAAAVLSISGGGGADTNSVAAAANASSASASSEGGFDLTSMVTGAAASFFSDPTTNSSGGNTGTTSNAPAPAVNSLKVPWSETNAALGQAALLLTILQQKPNSGIVFKSHELMPLGSSSKVGIKQSDGRPSVEYNLFYTDESFSFFGKRNFNTALEGLFRCLKDAMDVAARRDRTASPPHELVIPTGRGEITIGGLPIAYEGSDGLQWSRAMKYFLTDLKWLTAFSQKTIDT